MTTVNAIVDTPPDPGNVYEGWLVDSDGALSFGTFRNGELNFQEYMTKPFIYDEFIVTRTN